MLWVNPQKPNHVATIMRPHQDHSEANGRVEEYLEDIERDILVYALETCRWNKTTTAKYLGISSRSLRYRLKKLNIK